MAEVQEEDGSRSVGSCSFWVFASVKGFLSALVLVVFDVFEEGYRVFLKNKHRCFDSFRVRFCDFAM